MERCECHDCTQARWFMMGDALGRVRQEARTATFDEFYTLAEALPGFPKQSEALKNSGTLIHLVYEFGRDSVTPPKPEGGSR